MGVRARVPISLASVLFVAVVALGGPKVWSSVGLVRATLSAALVAYLAWLVVETWLVSWREISLPNAPRDRASCELYALSQGCTVVLALLLPSWESGGRSLVGLLLLLLGFTLRLSAVVSLGHYYSRRVRLLDDHRVVTYGPYQFVRHPAYLGTLVAHLGFVLVFFHWAPLLVWVALFVPLVVRRILLEEPLLYQLDGYAAYARSRKRLLPLVW